MAHEVKYKGYTISLMDGITIRDGKLFEQVWSLECESPPIPDNLKELDGYGNKKAKFDRKVPGFMTIQPSQVSEDGSIAYTEKQKAYVSEEVRRISKDGYWCFIGGSLTWLTPWQYFGLKYWKTRTITSRDYLDYRDRQRRILLYGWNVWKHTRDKGFTYLKFRQDGATTWQHIMAYWAVAFIKRKQFVGLSSSDMELSETNFQELFAESFKELPTWLKPGVFNLTNTGFALTSGGQKTTKNNTGSIRDEGRGSSVIIKALTKRGFDGKRIDWLLPDEVAKWLRVNITKWWAKQLPGLYELAFLPSTMEEIDNGGGDYKKFWYSCDITTMGDMPHTASKCRNLFIRSSDGRPKFIGPYGESIIYDPTDEQWEHMKAQNPEDFFDESQRMGAAEYRRRRIQQLEESGQQELLDEERRAFPETIEEAFSVLQQNNPFETGILDKLHISVREAINQWVLDGVLKQGRFEWVDRKNFAVVRWIDDPKGPVLRTWEPPVPNAYRHEGGMRKPVNKAKAVFGIDTYAKAQPKGQGSKQGMVGKRYFDPLYERKNADHRSRYGRDMDDYIPTPSIFYAYIHRNAIPGADYDQALMAAVYYSAPIAVENNRSEAFENYCSQRGLFGYLLKEWEIKGVNPSKELDRIGIFTGSSEANKMGPVGEACEYHNDFLRGDSHYLGDFKYDIVQQPIRYPFLALIDDNRRFDIMDREKSDGTMAGLPAFIAEFNINGYGEASNYGQPVVTTIRKDFLRNRFHTFRRRA
jgi:hypothetical protein